MKTGTNVCSTFSPNQTLKKCTWTNTPSFKLSWRAHFKLLRGYRYSSNSPSDIWLLLLIINNNHPIFPYTFQHEFRMSKLTFSSASGFFKTSQTWDFSSLLTHLGFATARGLSIQLPQRCMGSASVQLRPNSWTFIEVPESEVSWSSFWHMSSLKPTVLSWRFWNLAGIVNGMKMELSKQSQVTDLMRNLYKYLVR